MGMTKSQCKAVLNLSSALFENASEFEDLELADTILNAVRDSDIYSDLAMIISTRFNGNMDKIQDDFGFLSKSIVLFIDDGKVTLPSDTANKYTYSIIEYMQAIDKGSAEIPEFMKHQHVICINYSMYKHANATGMFYSGYGNLAYIDIYFLKLMQSEGFKTLLKNIYGKDEQDKMYYAILELCSASEEILIHEISHYITSYKESGNIKANNHDYKNITKNLTSTERERYKRGDISHFYSTDSGNDNYYKLLYNTDDDEINSCIKECAYSAIIKEKTSLKKENSLNSNMSNDYMKKSYEEIYKRMSADMISHAIEVLDFKRSNYPASLRNKIMKRIYYVAATFSEYAVRFPDKVKYETLAETLHGISVMDPAGFDFAMKITDDSPYAENTEPPAKQKLPGKMKGFFAKLFGKEE